MKYQYINPNTKKVLEPSLTAFEIDKNYQKELDIINVIKLYTMYKEKILFKSLSNVLLKKFSNMNFNNIKFDDENNNYNFITKDGEIISFDILSNYIEEKNIKKELTSKRRKGKCHEMSIRLSNSLKDSKVLTGYIIIDNYKILHSVVEKNKDGKVEIIDWTTNLIMDKEEYIKLFNFTSLSPVSSIDILNDLEKIKEIFPGFPVKYYLVFRDEIMKDLENNNFIFEKKDSENKERRVR